MQLRVESWNGNLIRFVGEKDNWMAVGFDVAKALGYKRPNDAIRLHVEPQDRENINLVSTVKHRRIATNSITIRYGTQQTDKTNSRLNQAEIKRGNPNVIVITEFGIYDLVFSSKMPEAKEFKRWVYSVIQHLRKQSGLESYQALEMLDKQVQRQAMERLDAYNQVDYIKANSITNKAIANKYGLPKMIKKQEMTAEMKKDRPAVLNDVVDLMNIKRRFGLDISVSKTIYDKTNK